MLIHLSFTYSAISIQYLCVTCDIANMGNSGDSGSENVCCIENHQITLATLPQMRKHNMFSPFEIQNTFHRK